MTHNLNDYKYKTRLQYKLVPGNEIFIRLSTVSASNLPGKKLWKEDILFSYDLIDCTQIAFRDLKPYGTCVLLQIIK